MLNDRLSTWTGQRGDYKRYNEAAITNWRLMTLIVFFSVCLGLVVAFSHEPAAVARHPREQPSNKKHKEHEFKSQPLTFAAGCFITRRPSCAIGACFACAAHADVIRPESSSQENSISTVKVQGPGDAASAPFRSPYH